MNALSRSAAGLSQPDDRALGGRSRRRFGQHQGRNAVVMVDEWSGPVEDIGEVVHLPRIGDAVAIKEEVLEPVRQRPGRGPGLNRCLQLVLGPNQTVRPIGFESLVVALAAAPAA